MRRPCRGEPAVIRQLVSPIHWGKVNSADKLYLVIESVKTDAKNRV